MRASPAAGEAREVPHSGSGNGITYIGHATVLIELGGVRLLTDPVLRTRIAHLRRHGPAPEVPADLDAVLISHMHHDHLDLPSLRLLSGPPRALAPRGAGRLLERAGFATDELRPGDVADVRGVRVEAVQAVHSPRRFGLAGLRGQPLGFVVRTKPSVYFAGDTDLFAGMRSLAPVDVALLPIAGYAPRLGPGHLNSYRAAQSAALLRARVAIPIHWGTLHPRFTRRGEWFSGPGDEFAAHVAELAPDCEARVLRPGEATSFDA
jgi:L-ascorbate metabolism protein UlaG (beta-lactamase superfamily)